MYSALWKILPGPTWARVTMLAGAAVIVVMLLMMFVFPTIDNFMSSTDPGVR